MAEVDVTIYISRALDVKVVKRLRLGQTIRELRGLLAADDPTNQTTVESIGLARMDSNAPLHDDDPITEELSALEVCSPGADAVAAPESSHVAGIQDGNHLEIAASPQAATSQVSCEPLPTAPCRYRVLQRSLVKKVGTDPSSEKVVKLTRKVGDTVRTTGRTWTGARGGEWVELDSAEKPGWLLVEGPGFGVPGPLLQKVEINEEAPLILKVVMPQVVRDPDNLDKRDIVLKPSSTVADAKMWIKLLFGLEPHQIMMTPPERSGSSKFIKSVRGKTMSTILKDDESMADAEYADGDELNFTYIGKLIE